MYVMFTFPKILSVKNDKKILHRMQFYIKVSLLKCAVNPFRLTGEGTLSRSLSSKASLCINKILLEELFYIYIVIQLCR